MVQIAENFPKYFLSVRIMETTSINLSSAEEMRRALKIGTYIQFIDEKPLEDDTMNQFNFLKGEPAE